MASLPLAEMICSLGFFSSLESKGTCDAIDDVTKSIAIKWLQKNQANPKAVKLCGSELKKTICMVVKMKTAIVPDDQEACRRKPTSVVVTAEQVHSEISATPLSDIKRGFLELVMEKRAGTGWGAAKASGTCHA